MIKMRGVLCLFGLVYPIGCYAQAVLGNGAVTGTVVDYTGSGIPNTTVILSNEELAIRRTMDTSDDGGFDASALIPGAGYNLKVTRKGFLDVDYKGFDVLVGHTIHFKVTLAQDPAAAREAQKASLFVEDLTGGFADAFSQIEMDGLSTRNRDVNTLVPLAIGVTPDNATGKMAFHSEATTNAYVTDGILTSNTYFYNRPPIAPGAPQDAVEQMQVVSAGAPAEFGKTAGGTINVVTRSGGAAIHGAAYEYFNSPSLDARARFATAAPSGGQNQFGVNVGGPFRSKPIFWFVNLENLNRHFEELNRTSNPLLVNAAGTAILPSNCGTPATAAQCTAAIDFLNSQLNRSVGGSLTSLSGLAKVDWRPNEFNYINLEADAMHRHSPNGTNLETVASNAGVGPYNGSYSDESRYAKAGYTAVWDGNAINDLRGGWYHDRFSDYSNPQLLPSTGPLAIDIAGTPFGANPNFPMALSQQRYQIVDNFTVTAGNHLIRLGVDYSITENYNAQIIGKSGEYFYPSLTTFAEDFSGNTASHRDYTSYDQRFGKPVVDLHPKTMAVYAQDTWTATRRLSVNFGLQWEKLFTPQPTSTNVTFYQTGSIGTADLDFAPRLGLAYQLDRKTVIRASGGAFYQPVPGQLLQGLFTGNGIYQLLISVNPAQTNSLIFPHIAGSPNNAPASTQDITYSVAKFRNPVIVQGQFTIERYLGKGWNVSLNYLYNHGINLWTADDQNLNVPTVARNYTIDNAAGAAVGTYTTVIYTTKTTAGYAHVYEIQNGGTSRYDGATFQVRKRMSHGLAVQASYTWSHATDDVSESPVFAGFIPVATVPGQFAPDKGNSSFNQPSRAIVNWTWQPTFMKNDSIVARYLVNGWQISGIATFSSSLPETPMVLVNGQQFTGVTMEYLNSLNGSGGWSRVPFQSVNSLLTDRQYNVDARLTREFPIVESVKARIMFEAFNAFNTQYNTSVNNIAYVATSGVLRPVAGLGVGNGADGYPWGDNARRLQIALRIVF